MKLSKTSALALITTSLLSTHSLAATEIGGAVAIVQNQAITLAETAELNFGTFLPFGRQGSVTLRATDSRIFASNAHIITTGSFAQWAVTGVPTAPFEVTLPSSTQIELQGVTNEADRRFMTVDAFTRSGSSNDIILDADGNASFNVGARVIVGANQPAGTYRGEYEVTVNYN